jgi:hypothetical protein
LSVAFALLLPTTIAVIFPTSLALSPRLVFSHSITSNRRRIKRKRPINMAPQFNSASGILSVVGFALQSGESLYGTVSSFQSDESTIRDLREELESWNEVLKTLRQAATKRQVDFASLKLALYRCGRACEDLRIVLDKCAEHSSGSLAGFEDWEQVRYMGNNITEFKNVLACYKSTVRIVLDDVAM